MESLSFPPSPAPVSMGPRLSTSLFSFAEGVQFPQIPVSKAGCEFSSVCPLRKHSLSLFPREEGQRRGQCRHPHSSHPQHLSTPGFLLFLVQDVSLWLCPRRHWLRFSRLYLLSEFKRLLITDILIDPVL